MAVQEKTISKKYKMKDHKLEFLVVFFIVAVVLGVYFSWYEVKIFAPAIPEYGDDYDYKLSYCEAKKYIELFNKEKFYETDFPVTGEINIDDNVNFRIEMRTGFQKQTVYFHHIANIIYSYTENEKIKEYYYFDWFSDYFKYLLEVDRKHNGYIQQQGKEQWCQQTNTDQYNQYYYNSWCGWYDYWGTIYANGFMPLNQVVISLEFSYSNLGYLSPFKGYEYGDETIWDIYVKINPETDVFTYNGLEIMYVNGNCDLNSNFIVRPVDYIRKPVE